MELSLGVLAPMFIITIKDMHLATKVVESQQKTEEGTAQHTRN